MVCLLVDGSWKSLCRGGTRAWSWWPRRTQLNASGTTTRSWRRQGRICTPAPGPWTSLRLWRNGSWVSHGPRPDSTPALIHTTRQRHVSLRAGLSLQFVFRKQTNPSFWANLSFTLTFQTYQDRSERLWILHTSLFSDVVYIFTKAFTFSDQ